MHLRDVVERLASIYTPKETRRWLRTRHPLLHDQRPVDLIKSGRTADVLTVIDRLEAGAHL